MFHLKWASSGKLWEVTALVVLQYFLDVSSTMLCLKLWICSLPPTIIVFSVCLYHFAQMNPSNPFIMSALCVTVWRNNVSISPPSCHYLSSLLQPKHHRPSLCGIQMLVCWNDGYNMQYPFAIFLSMPFPCFKKLQGWVQEFTLFF